MGKIAKPQDNKSLAKMGTFQQIDITMLEYNEGQLPGCPKNPRYIKEEEYASLKKSLLSSPEFLEYKPLMVYLLSSGKYITICGNMRLRAANDLLKGGNGQFASLPCFALNADTSIAKIKEYAIKDNVQAGSWDWDDLANDDWEVEDLQDWGVDCSFLTDTEPVDELSGRKETEDDNYDEDEHEIETICKAGEIYQLGSHRLMCGDSANPEDVKKLMGGDLANMVFTDPPYGVSIGDKNAALNSVQSSKRCCENIKNDTLGPEELYPILVSAMSNCRLNCHDDATYFVTSPQGGDLGMMMMMMMKDAGLPVRHILIWEKNSATFSLGRLDYDYQHEPIFYTWTKSHKNYRNGENRTTIWKYDKPRKCDLHPTMKPIALVANCMKDGTQEGDVVLDVFGGSGTTIMAAEQLGRKARLMELDPHYCDVIINRWEQFTGLKAEKIEG